MRLPLLIAMLAIALSSSAFAQSTPEDEWQSLPGQPPRVEPPAPAPPAPSSSGDAPRALPTPTPARPQEPSVVWPAKPAEIPNDVSVFGASTLGAGRRGVGIYLGFPLMGIRAGVGLMPAVDMGLSFDTFFGVMNDARAFLKLQLFKAGHWTAAGAVDGGAAFFIQPADAEGRGPRWLTGRRNYNAAPGLLLSYRDETPRGIRFFLDARCNLAFDTEPFQRDPLGGVPPDVQIAPNFPVRLGAEVPFSGQTSYLLGLGFDIHGRPEDSVFMPVAYIGLVTTL